MKAIFLISFLSIIFIFSRCEETTPVLKDGDFNILFDVKNDIKKTNDVFEKSDENEDFYDVEKVENKDVEVFDGEIFNEVDTLPVQQILEGDLIITEMMVDSEAVSDYDGEYFEIFNKKNIAVDLRGFVFHDKTGDKFKISGDEPIIIEPQSYFVICRNANINQNGGIPCDYESSNFLLSNNKDEIIMEYNGNVIDEVFYDANTFSIMPGHSLNLSITKYDYLENDKPENWCLSETLLANGDYGTPGAENMECVVEPECGNGIKEGDEECDDGDNNSDTTPNACRKDCTLPVCGDGVTDDDFGEECDNGDDNSDDEPNACRKNCKLPVCGDGITDDEYEEECDDGNKVDNDGCSSTCKIEIIPEYGDIIITEIMPNPSAVEDSKGEWFEIYNNSDKTFNLNGLIIKDDGSNFHKLNTQVEPCEKCENFAPGSYLVLGRNKNFETNGNINVDYAYGSSFQLNNTKDEVVLVFKNKEIDRVVYDKDAGFPIYAGKSITLSPDHFSADENDNPENFCAATTKMENGDFGTPGKPNDVCMNGPYCGDGNLDEGEECDDGNFENGDGCSKECKIEGPFSKGDIIITELFIDPAEMPDEKGEFVEIYNTTDKDIDIRGFVLKDDVEDYHKISGKDPVVVPAKGFFVLGINSDTQTNGGKSIDYQYDNFLLANDKDQVVLVWNGIEIDRVEYDSSTFPIEEGKSLSLDKFAFDADKNDKFYNWCAMSPTPDEFNPSCPVPPGCGDGVKEEWEECDDGENNSDTVPNACRTNCKLPSCGDGVTDDLYGEECDEGENNSNTEPNACRENCMLPSCGDGVLDTQFQEECDDGNLEPGDGCDEKCKKESEIPEGALIITEIMADPKNVPDENGEYFEIYNTSGQKIRLNGVVIKDKVGDYHKIMEDSDIFIDPQSFFVLGINKDIEKNGGVEVDYQYSSFQLANDFDEITLLWMGKVIDSVYYDIDKGWVIKEGYSLNLSKDKFSAQKNDDPVAWCASSKMYDEFNYGTPGEPNDVCLVPECGNGVIDSGEECDDGENNSDTTPNACRTDCTLPSCGDGVVDDDYGEECDKGDKNSDIVPNACRTNCKLPSCGDNVIDDEFGEECDDGGTESGDGCSKFCKTETDLKEGDLIITEFMANPAVTADSKGEWFEIYNTTDKPIVLNGLVIKDKDTDKFVVDPDDELKILPQEYKVFVRNDNPDQNGGIAGGILVQNFQLSNSADEIILVYHDKIIDQVYYNKTDFKIVSGKSLNLDINSYSAEANDSPENYCLPSVKYGSGDFGTPGAKNQSCSLFIESVFPDNAPDFGGTKVEIKGENLDQVTKILFGESEGVITVQSSKQLTVVTPSATAGYVNVVFKTPNSDFTLDNGFRFTGTNSNIDWAKLQWPLTLEVTAGSESDFIYGRVFEDGVTPSNCEQITAEAGYGPKGTTPLSDPQWIWFPLSLNEQCQDCGNNCEFMGKITAPIKTGEYSFTVRFSLDNGINYKYGDTSGVGVYEEPQAENMGTLQVN